MRNVQVFDNGETIDRYTVVIYDRGQYDAYGMSDNALSPNGFNMYIGQVGDQVHPSFLDTCDKVNLRELPKDVLVAIIDRLEKSLNINTPAALKE